MNEPVAGLVRTLAEFDLSSIDAIDQSLVRVAGDATVATSETPTRTFNCGEGWRNLSSTEQLAIAWVVLLLTLLPYTVQAAIAPDSTYNPVQALAGSAQAVLESVVAALIILVVQENRD